MAGERYTTTDEDALLRMVRQAGGSPEGAAQNLFARLEALEALAAQLQAEQEAVVGEAVPPFDQEEDTEAEPPAATESQPDEQ